MAGSQDNQGRENGGQGRTQKGPGLGDMFERLVSDGNPVLSQIDRNAKALAQSALSRLDVVSRAEFDAQSAVLQRTRKKVEQLEAEVERLTKLLEQKSAS